MICQKTTTRVEKMTEEWVEANKDLAENNSREKSGRRGYNSGKRRRSSESVRRLRRNRGNILVGLKCKLESCRKN